jgi:hypothetical protein
MTPKLTLFCASALIALFTVGLSGKSACASTIFDDFGSGDSYQEGVGWTVAGASSSVGYYQPSMLFTPAVTASVSQIIVGIGNVDATTPDSATFSLYTDNGGALGTSLGSWSVTGLPASASTADTVETISGITGVTLTGGTAYFLSASAPSTTWDSWNENSTGITGTVLLDCSESFCGTTDGTLGAFEILGSPVSATPLPAALPLFAGGLGALGLLGCRRKRKAQAAA